VFEATLTLDAAPTPTGYSWTIGDGPSTPVTAGTLADAWVITFDQPVVGWLTR